MSFYDNFYLLPPTVYAVYVRQSWWVTQGGKVNSDMFLHNEGISTFFVVVTLTLTYYNSVADTVLCSAA